jgi:large subunit ribosomal protein L2
MKSYNPTTPSRRHYTAVEYRKLVSKGGPKKQLTKRLKSHGGRNNQGRITMRHQGGGNKKVYRIVDFKQMKLDVPGVIRSVEYDPYRSGFIALVSYKDGEYRYILASSDMKPGMVVVTSVNASFDPGNRTNIGRIPVGSFVYNIELQPGKGGQMARSAGSYAQILAHDSGYTQLKMSSGEIRRILSLCFASIGKVSNHEYSLTNIGKAGRSRALGIRPTVRGTAMNPRDHPYGGGEGSQPRGTRKPKTKWGKVTGGRKTRDPKKWSSKLIMKRRAKKR